ncbi:PAS domain-containing protein [Limimaricola litoreus]|uniref:histidine kinase n=1 Tax=Limimaricola litoreus TaxID=2955316 RepID=A0A9X2JP08_9RHOB|nr:PAS domain-containing protein [Limimaricola litoreus]MCP1167580.1 PAS domain-containing protein [Limimaricola litoreus]
MEAIEVVDLDRTGRHREETAFLAALDQAPLPMWLSDPDYEGTYFNTAWLAFRGRTLEQEIGGGWLTGIHPDDLPALDGYASALTDGRPFQVEYRLRRHDGVWRWFLDTGKPRLDEEGRLLGYIGSCVDITDRRETAQALGHAQARLELAQEGAALGVYDWDMAANRLTWSEQMFRLYGLSPDIGAQGEPDALIAAWMGRLHPEDRARCAADLRECLDSREMERLTMSFRVMHPETGLRWIEGRGRLLRDAQGRPARLTGVNFDTTEQHRREEARARAAMLLRMSADLADLGTWELDPATRKVTACPHAAALLGLPEGDAPWPLAAVLARLAPEDREAMRTELRAVLEQDAETTGVYRVQNAEGRTRWLSTRGRMVRLLDGSTRLIGALTDVTDERRREAEREAELERRRILLSELNHRMKNNLHLILSMLRLEANRSGRPECFDAATKRIEAVADLHAQLGFGEDAGHLRFDAYLDELAEKLRRSALEGTEIALDCTTEPVDLDLGRAVPLGLVINELVTNAIKYAFPANRGRIELGLGTARDGTIRILVSDDGIGPDAEPDAQPASGLGAGLVTGLCAQIGARIESRSLPGMRHEILLPPKG